MAGAIGYGLSNLRRFSGRDPRGRFWTYAAVVVLVGKGVQILFALPFIEKMQATAQGRLHSAVGADLGADTPTSLHALYPDLGADVVALAWKSAIVSLVMIALLAASVSRRLHDAGRTAYFGLMPLLFMAFGLGSIRQVVLGLDRPESLDGKLIGALIVNGLLYVAALIALIVLLASPGVRGPSLHGPDPQG